MILLFVLACTSPTPSQIAAAQRAEIPGKDGAPGKDGLPGVNGVDGRDGIDGVDGAPGRDGRDGPHWVDATGAVVTEGTSLIWFDPSGNYWAVDPETGAVGPRDRVYVYHDNDDCTGPGYVVAHSPREVFAVGTANVSRPPDMLTITLTYASFTANDVCEPADGTFPNAIPRDGLNAVSVDRSFVGPLALVP